MVYLFPACKDSCVHHSRTHLPAFRCRGIITAVVYGTSRCFVTGWVMDSCWQSYLESTSRIRCIRYSGCHILTRHAERWSVAPVGSAAESADTGPGVDIIARVDWGPACSSSNEWYIWYWLDHRFLQTILANLCCDVLLRQIPQVQPLEQIERRCQRKSHS